MKKGDLINLKITQGTPCVHNAIIYKISKDIACIHIDLKSKYCDCDCDYSFTDEDECGIYISETKRSLNLNKKFKNKDTGITFVDFKGWQVFATASGRYTISVCLVKK